MEKQSHRKGKQYTAETYMLANGKTGDVFYTKKKDGSVTAMNVAYKRKIKTERILAVNLGNPPNVEYITKVTILE